MGLSLVTQNLGIPDGLAGWQVLKKRSMTSFSQFTSDPMLKSQIAYFKANIGKADTVDKFLKDPRLQDVAFSAYGLTAQIGANGLMKQVLTSDLTSKASIANKLTTQGYRQLAAALNFGAASTPAVPATASSARTTVDGLRDGDTFAGFSGTFGGVTLTDVDLSGATTPDQLAATLTKAFQAADKGSSNITVSTVGFDLVFKDAAGRGSAGDFAWTPSASASTAPTMTAARELTFGSPAIAAKGGSNVNNASAVQAIVDKYTQAKFNEVVGGTSSILANAMNASQNLPAITNWYSVIANTKLATVVETALNLPTSFQKLNVDQQFNVLSSKMNVKDLQDSAKLGKLLDKYVAIATALDTGSSSAGTNSAAYQILSGVSDGWSSGSYGAMLTST